MAKLMKKKKPSASRPKAAKKKKPEKKKPAPAAKKPAPKEKPGKSAAVKVKAKPAPAAKIEAAPRKPEALEPPRFTKQELELIRIKLLGMLQDMQDEVQTELSVANARDIAHIQDESDIASDSAESDLALSLAEKQGAEVAEIERAIEKIDEGTYGICDITGKPINKERLEFLPWATRSVEAQGRFELRRRRKEEGDMDDLEDAGDDSSEDDS
ncbi:MAG: TraR/DksA C4-type zinc finger protein [Planctomycetota bacterium]|nr:TraR/DksA C4-type zinc finger protein [Planctomycetota bacterium]